MKFSNIWGAFIAFAAGIHEIAPKPVVVPVPSVKILPVLMRTESGAEVMLDAETEGE